jgi:hypothetical protein
MATASSTLEARAVGGAPARKPAERRCRCPLPAA